MPVANSAKVRRRKEEMSWDELGCYSSHSRNSRGTMATSAGGLDGNASFSSSPISSPRRRFRKSSSVHSHMPSSTGKSSSGLNEYLADNNGNSNDAVGGGISTPPPFGGGSQRSVWSRNSAATPPASPRPGRRKSRLEERNSSSLSNNNSSFHSRGSRSKSPIRGRSYRASLSKSPIQGRGKFSSTPDLPSIGEKNVGRKTSKSPISGRKKSTIMDNPDPPPPPPPLLDSTPGTPKTRKKTKKSPISDKKKKASQSPASKRKSNKGSDSKISNLSSSSDTKLSSGLSSDPLPAPKKVVRPNGKTVLIQKVPVTQEEADILNSRQDKEAAFREMEEEKGWGLSMAKIQFEKRPPRSLVLIWLLMAAELGFDLATTGIAFASFLGGEDCCGYEIELGFLPLGATIPFLLLVIAEMTLLSRAIALTLWPSLEYNHNEENQEDESKFQKYLHSVMCFLKWNAKMVLRAINLCTVINPFLSCLVAWVLMYEGDRTEALVVLGLEAGSIILHMIAVYLEGGFTSRKMLLFHCLPIIPFIITVSLCLVYLKNGGVCYLVGKKLFVFHGCEVCEEDGMPPVDGMCGNMTVADSGGNILDKVLFAGDQITDFTTRTLQDTYCAGPDDPVQVNFCFYAY